MGAIEIGTASWTDRTLLASGWYPPSADTPEKRLAYYAGKFPVVEVDSTYYGPPAEQTSRLWAQRTPEGFTFNIKAFSLLTGHPTKVSAIYKDLRPETDKKNVYPGDLPPQAYEEIWTRFLSALDPLSEAGKLGAVLFQFPPWFGIRKSNKEYLLEVAARCKPIRPVFEFRNASWFDDDVYAALRQAGAALVLSEREDATPPPMVETAGFGYVRLRLENYSEADLDVWAQRLNAAGWKEAFVYFMHEPTAPAYAQSLMRLAAA